MDTQLLSSFQLEKEPAETQQAPQDITQRTLADPAALLALQAPGELLFEDDFETEASLKKYFEVRGLKQGRARLVHGAGLGHGGERAIRFDAPEKAGTASGSGPAAGSVPRDTNAFTSGATFVSPRTTTRAT